MSRMPITLDALNGLDEMGFVQALDGIVEHAPWVAASAARSRPFTTVADLHAAMMRVIQAKPESEQIEFLNRLPELGGHEAKAGALTPESAAEHASVGIGHSAGDGPGELDALNTRYSERFGFPFIICVRRQTRAAVEAALQVRLENEPAEEFRAALREIGHITRLRITDRVSGPGLPKVEGRLSTHVLDAHAGIPAQGVRIELFEIGQSPAIKVAESISNEDGRTSVPLLSDGPLRVGRYELVFGIGDYFRARGVAESCCRFLEDVVIRFGIDDPEGHLHVPLVATPWSYSTYRGS